MKLMSFAVGSRRSVGLVEGNHVKDLGPLRHRFGGTLRELLVNDGLAGLKELRTAELPSVALSDVTFLPVISDPQKILCIGINYASHVRETGREMPKYPMVFTRFADTQTGHRNPLIRPPNSANLDFEGELAVVIGRRAHRVAAAEALSFVAGYSCYNDGTLRDWQRHTAQFIPGKNFPQTGGFGPWLVTTDEIADPSRLHLTTRVNGAVMQDTETSDMIFDVAHLIEYCSAFTPLSAGDVIVTGTTGGVGAFREPPLWLKPGDTVEVEISGIGVLHNTVRDE
jgi:2-keto-4-pentenoate hydratase/2-oxohepta-3-ene-1,7-dioic acid hydratase in catechol pathway